MGNIEIPYPICIGKNTYFLSNHYAIIKTKNIENGKLLGSLDSSLDPYVYHLSKCGEKLCGKRLEKIQLFDKCEDEDRDEDVDEEVILLID